MARMVRWQVVAVVMAAVVIGMAGLSSGGLAEECAAQIQQLTNCLTFVTGKESNPSKGCCTSVTTMKDKQPACLCYFTGEAHNGSQAIKSLGIQEAKLLQLPDACHLVNASVTNCPKLLGISPSSPAAAIFMNKNASSSSAASTSPSSPSSDKSSGLTRKENGALMLGSFIVTLLVTVNPIAALPISL